MRLLLSSVFGPFAVDDAFGRKENRMELFHNQVTREQGVFSYRFNHHSFGLYMMAENIDIPQQYSTFRHSVNSGGNCEKVMTMSASVLLCPMLKRPKKWPRSSGRNFRAQKSF